MAIVGIFFFGEHLETIWRRFDYISTNRSILTLFWASDRMFSIRGPSMVYSYIYCEEILSRERDVVDEGRGEEPRAVQVGIKGPKVVMKKNKAS
jgi:hypothetical protein